MDRRTRRVLQCFLPALVQPPPDVTQCFDLLYYVIVHIIRLPADPLLDIRRRLFGSDEHTYGGRNIFPLFAQHRYHFFEVTGETPETFLLLVEQLHICSFRRHSLSIRNRVLLMMMWLRCYNTFHMLSALFNISLSTVKEEIRTLIPIFYLRLKTFIIWPSVEQWQSMTYTWEKIPAAVGAIDGTSHEINRPSNEPQQPYYSGHRNYHCIHSQVIVDNAGRIRYIECGFIGHLNDAQQFGFMRNLGNDLPFPDDCVLLGDKIYPNRHPIVTPYSEVQLRLRNDRWKRKCRKLNTHIRQYRVCVEHAIAEIKCYRSVGTIWRHRREVLPRVVNICTGLVCRKKQIGLIL